MFLENLKKLFRFIYIGNLFGFIFFASLSIIIGILESFSYSGFFLKHFHVPLEPIIYIAVLSGYLVCITPLTIEISKKCFNSIKKMFLVNMVFMIVLIIITLAVCLIEKINYPNFIYSKIHLQPQLLLKPVVLSGYVLFVNLTLVLRAKYFKKSMYRKPKFKEILRILFRSKPNFKDWSEVSKAGKNIRLRLPYAQGLIYVIYAIFLFVFVLTNSIKTAGKFYKVDLGFRQENELKYTLGKININKWVEEYFPLTKKIIFWCEKQKKPVELVSFDPQIIWNSYEGLSRVFLTNCNYVNINSLDKTYKYLEEKKLLLVSITPCDPKLESYDASPDKDIMEYFRIINNKFVCNSREIIQGLYLYEGG